MATVLIVDDDPDFVSMTRVVLETHGYEVGSAGSAAEAQKAIEKKRPDLIILDVMMESLCAGMLAQNLSRGEFRDVPVLMVTSITEKTGFPFDPTKDQDYMPVSAYLEKPVKSDELIARVQSLLGEE